MKGNYQNLLEDYQSIYTGAQIDERLTKAGTAVQGVKVDGVELPKDSDNKVNLPQIATPEDVDAKVAAETQRATAKESELQDAINTKQPIIADIDTIRQGAAKGATAVQPAAIADMETRTHASNTYATKTEVNTGLAAKQDVIADLATIRQGAAKGATAVQRTELLNYYTKEQIEATYATKLALDEKIERVELWYNQPANSICLLGSTTPLSYSQIAAYVDDKKKFVTLLDIDGEYLLPQWNDGGALIFTGLNVLSYGTWAHRIAINIDEDIKAEYYEVQQKLIPGANITIENNVISAIGGGSGIPDAPIDGKLYGRKNGAWNEAASKSELDTLSLKVGNIEEQIGNINAILETI